MSEGLRITKSMASSSRKAFWLLKSINHVQAMILMIENYEHDMDECYADLLDIVEQLFLILYYFYENLVFMARTKLVSFTEDSLDDWGNWTWFLEDFICFLAASLRSYIAAKKLGLKEAALLQLTRHSELEDKNLVLQVRGDIISEGTNLRYNIIKEIEELKKRYSDSLLSTAIVSCVGLSIPRSLSSFFRTI